MSKLVVELVAKAKATIEPFSRTLADITMSAKTNLYSVSYVGKTLVDVVSGIFFTFYNILFGDSTSVTETKSVDFGKVVSDTASTLDIKSTDLNKPTQDSLSLTDSLSSQTYFIRDFLDSYNVSDTSNLLFLKSNTDTVGVGDNIDSFVFDRNRTFFDQVSATDDINGAAVDDDQNVLFFTSKTDSSNVGEYISFQNTFIRSVLETTGISNSGTIVSQNYTDGPSYFLEDYVGVSRTIT